MSPEDGGGTTPAQDAAPAETEPPPGEPIKTHSNDRPDGHSNSDTFDPVTYAQRLIDHKIPVVVCTPNLRWYPGAPDGVPELFYPKSWNAITAAECDLSTFRPGIDALAAVCGHRLDAVDEDTKANGTIEHLPPFTCYGVHHTPSGGRHYFIPSTGIGKISPLTTDRGHVGDYCGGTAEGGSRALTFLPGSTRPKYPGKTYTVEEAIDLDKLLAAEPDQRLADALIHGCGGRLTGRPGRAAASRAEVDKFLKQYDHPIEPPCNHGRKAVKKLLANAKATVPGDPVQGRHGWCTKTLIRLVGLIRAGCANSNDVRAVKATLEKIKPEGDDFDGMVAWALNNSTGKVNCHVHCPADDGRPAHCLWNSVESFRWLLDELGTRGLSGIFLRGTTPVLTYAIGEEGYIEPTDERDHNGPATLRTVTADSIRARLGVNYRIYIVNDGDAEIEIFFPADAARLALDALDQAPNLRRLRGVTHTPIARADGTVLTQPGYDADTGFLLLPDVDVPPVPERPSPAQLQAAVLLLRGIVGDFTWAGEHDEANLFGLLLTPLLRLLSPPPYKLGCFMAHQPGSGKTLLADLLRLVHGGVFRGEMPHDDAELSKSLTSILNCTTAPVVQFDNVTGTLRSSRLAALLTSADYTDRVLGSTNNVTLPNDRLWVLTGNNVNLGGDLVRRALWVTIDPGVPDPHLRTGFRIPDLRGWVSSNRAAVLHALLTLIAAWSAAGRPMPVSSSSDSYGRWTATVRGILGHAGIPGVFDHADSAQQKVGLDDEGWGEFLKGVHDEFGDREFTARQLVDRLVWKSATMPASQDLIDNLPDELAAELDRNGKINAKKMGRWLENRDRRWAGELCSQKCGRDSSNTTRYRVAVHASLTGADGGATPSDDKITRKSGSAGSETGPTYSCAFDVPHRGQGDSGTQEKSGGANNTSGTSGLPGDLAPSSVETAGETAARSHLAARRAALVGKTREELAAEGRALRERYIKQTEINIPEEQP